MDKHHKEARVIRTNEQRSPRNVRRLGLALIALAQAQLEAEAQAQAEANAAHGQGQPGSQKPAGNKPSRPSGAAA